MVSPDEVSNNCLMSLFVFVVSLVGRLITHRHLKHNGGPNQTLFFINNSHKPNVLENDVFICKNELLEE